MVQQLLREPFERIDASRARRILDEKSAVWVDVREQNEWDRGHIPGAKLVPLNTLLMSPRQYLNGDAIVFYCAHGIRSAVACEVAAAVGVPRIYNLEGGIVDWVAKGHPIDA